MQQSRLHDIGGFGAKPLAIHSGGGSSFTSKNKPANSPPAPIPTARLVWAPINLRLARRAGTDPGMEGTASFVEPLSVDLKF